MKIPRHFPSSACSMVSLAAFLPAAFLFLNGTARADDPATLVSGQVEDYALVGSTVYWHAAATCMEFEGTVVSVSPTVDMRSRTAKVEILIDNPVEGASHALKPGMFARARVVTAELADVLVVSDHAVQKEGEEHVAFVVAEGRAHRRVVTVGTASGGRVTISEGLAEGELVVEGVAGLRDGGLVKTEEASRE